jgi:hypothetical protein
VAKTWGYAASFNAPGSRNFARFYAVSSAPPR